MCSLHAMPTIHQNKILSSRNLSLRMLRTAACQSWLDRTQLSPFRRLSRAHILPAIIIISLGSTQPPPLLPGGQQWQKKGKKRSTHSRSSLKNQASMSSLRIAFPAHSRLSLAMTRASPSPRPASLKNRTVSSQSSPCRLSGT